ncbi:hypothetical protein M5K25_027032 [Dendrobium thyrsiflorum]|uniref:Uncharacterized protein n=1 Tax=Dendrobium thyrsiflorum TaxID=117978 RepID=A0ABD0TZA9_DENTH
MDDGPDQDPMVPSSRAIVVPSLLSQRSPNFGSLPVSPPLRGNFRSHSLPATTRKPCTVGVGGHRGRSLRLRHANRGVHGSSGVPV